eukprot:TRINITY_DN13581_c0_g1_i4.p1 TRINITY_DN13581_c0_g1~~TRINITY_DN13581_c0_g1_i4.p1  ORF type:complete len:190 (-),score=6.19 TRINITY_DN13581_c0_g1_i4:286-855(-)
MNIKTYGRSVPSDLSPKTIPSLTSAMRKDTFFMKATTPSSAAGKYDNTKPVVELSKLAQSNVSRSFRNNNRKTFIKSGKSLKDASIIAKQQAIPLKISIGIGEDSIYPNLTACTLEVVSIIPQREPQTTASKSSIRTTPNKSTIKYKSKIKCSSSFCSTKTKEWHTVSDLKEKETKNNNKIKGTLHKMV